MTLQNTIQELIERKTTHVAGMFSIHANEAFLNGSTGQGGSEDKNISAVKQYWGKYPIPYVSSQSWRRWLRNTLIDETGWKPSVIEAIEWNASGNTSQVGGQFDPINYQEDDIFGYMLAKAKDNESLHENLERSRLPEVKLIRISPFKSSLLSGVPDLIKINEDEGFVHLRKDQPLPYKTEFYSGELTAVFGLEMFRLGVFENVAANESDAKQRKSDFELDPYIIENSGEELETIEHPGYQNGEIVYVSDLKNHQNTLTSEVLKALVRLRGGSKQTQFGTDVSPKLIILCGLNAGNILFDDLLVAREGNPELNIKAFEEIVKDYSDKITTPVFIGLRTGYLNNEEEIKALRNVGSIGIEVGTPIEVVDKFVGNLD